MGECPASIPYGPKTRSAESQVQPRVTSPSETSELDPASVPETPRIKQETPQSWTRRIPPARQPFMTDASVAAVTTAWLDRAGEVGHCWFIQTAREISRKRNGSRHFDIGSSHYRRRQGLSRMARKLDPPHPKFNQGLHLRPKLRDLRVGECPENSTDQTGDAKIVDTAHSSGVPAVHD